MLSVCSCTDLKCNVFDSLLLCKSREKCPLYHPV
uniref:Uncharacterized protein n=1 Tax=Rhizophora mucronata TaxID=61149 RepID=A0A2P2PI82_RHIMU